MAKRIVIVGGVACGPKTAARARRRDPEAEIVIVERGPFVSYAGCGLPYYVSGVIPEVAELMKTGYGTLRDALFFDRVKKVRVLARTEALSIDRARKTVTVRDLQTRAESELPYDALVLTTGSAPVRPPIPGMELDNVLTLRQPDEAESLRHKIEAGEADRVCVIGAGRIGLEVAESLSNQSVATTIIDVADQALPGLLDPEMARLVAHSLRAEKVNLFLGEKVKAFTGENGKVTRVITDRREIETDAVLVAVGVRPETTLARAAGIALGATGAILVDDHLRTNDPAIYAGGDCVENVHLVTGKKVWAPLGSTANRHGRVLGDNITGHDAVFPGILATGILRTLGTNIGSTGITETQARALGYEVWTCISPSGDRSHFYPGGKIIVIKLVADKKTGRLLGAQIVGPGDVVRRLDIVTATIAMKGTIDDLGNMDLAYAPPFGSAIEATAHAANILRNKRDGLADAMSPDEFRARLSSDDPSFLVLDVRTKRETETAGKIDDPRYLRLELEELRARVDELPRDRQPLIVCAVGARAYEATRFLKSAGFADARFVEGGMSFYLRAK
jgi:NADPH-dependent 2,4-dienoyl-CoA reductase/sulfur reductase-like enzyme/rhodanese-related sulfurtransferase